MTSASSGTICTTSSMINTVVRNLNRWRATAVAASRASRDEITTVDTATTELLTRNCQNGVPGTRSPVSTSAKCDSVGSAGTGRGVVEKISGVGLNAVPTIHSTGKTATANTTSPVVLST